ncbi:MAG: hypothetical protein H6709_13740 [Kofleriaceae bacterium]|nr:hypothetical protein [Kofleriaceae bacterium]MCB9573141.1 hypothetical protein [Kofleriaceae bacterium]
MRILGHERQAADDRRDPIDELLGLGLACDAVWIVARQPSDVAVPRRRDRGRDLEHHDHDVVRLTGRLAAPVGIDGSGQRRQAAKPFDYRIQRILVVAEPRPRRVEQPREFGLSAVRQRGATSDFAEREVVGIWTRRLRSLVLRARVADRNATAALAARGKNRRNEHRQRNTPPRREHARQHGRRACPLTSLERAQRPMRALMSSADTAAAGQLSPVAPQNCSTSPTQIESQ